MKSIGLILGMSLLLLHARFGTAQTRPAVESKATPARAGEVTLKGVMMLEEACTPKPAKETRHSVVLFALEGTPEVAATLDAIMKENWPGDSMDANQARHLNDAFSARLKYYFTPGETRHEVRERLEGRAGLHVGRAVGGRDRRYFRERRKEMDHAQQGIHPISRQETGYTQVSGQDACARQAAEDARQETIDPESQR